MQPDAFYRLPTVRNFVRDSGGRDIRVIVDIGANVGDMLLLLHDYFPNARIIGFEPVREYFDIALQRTQAIGRI